MSFDPISQDLPINPDFPPSSTGIEIDSHGSMLHGVMYRAGGEGTHPLIILLHGIPGHERNFDLAHILWRAGYHVAVFHYRGSWGSAGDYRFAHVLADVEAVINHYKQDTIAQQHRIDTSRILLMGHSLGGWASLVGLMRGQVTIAIAIASANVGLMGAMIEDDPDIQRKLTAQFLDPLTTPLTNVTGADLVIELEAHADEWDYTQHTKQFVDKKLLVIGAEQDEIAPVGMYHHPFVTLLTKRDPQYFTHTILDTDHSFSGKRVALARLILNWLHANL